MSNHEAALYFVAAEAITNVVKYAQASAGVGLLIAATAVKEAWRLAAARVAASARHLKGQASTTTLADDCYAH